MSGLQHFRICLSALALAAVAGCGAASTSTPTSPTAPATATDTFSGTLAQSGTVTHIFAVAANGTVEISLTSVAPLATMSLGVGVATSDGTSCLAAISQTADARSGSIALKGTAAVGNYCVRVYDSGNIPTATDVTYTLQVTHP